MRSASRKIIPLLMATSERPLHRCLYFLSQWIDFDVPPQDATVMIYGARRGEVSEESLARWIRDNWPKA